MTCRRLSLPPLLRVMVLVLVLEPVRPTFSPGTSLIDQGVYPTFFPSILKSREVLLVLLYVRVSSSSAQTYTQLLL